MTVSLAPHERLVLTATFGRPPAGWDREVRDAGGNTFHSSAMGAIALAQGREPVYLRAEQAGRVVAHAVAEAGRSRRPIGWRRHSVLELKTMPVLAPGSGVTLQQVVDAVRRLAATTGFGRIQFSSFADPQPADTAALALDGYRVTPRLEFRVSLGADLEETLAGMTAQHRRNIRKGLSAGCEFVEDSTLDGAIALRALQDVTYARRHEQGNYDARAWPVADYRVAMQALLASNSIRFWFVRRDGAPQSGIGVMTFGRWAYYFLGGTSREGYANRAAFALFGEVIRTLTAEGNRELNLGGMAVGAEDPSHIEHGLYRFKTGFGARVVRCQTAEGPP